MEKEILYMPPQIEIIEVEVENGFAGSSTYGFGESPEWNIDEIY